jgi:hypothetical protein
MAENKSALPILGMEGAMPGVDRQQCIPQLATLYFQSNRRD